MWSFVYLAVLCHREVVRSEVAVQVFVAGSADLIIIRLYQVRVVPLEVIRPRLSEGVNTVVDIVGVITKVINVFNPGVLSDPLSVNFYSKFVSIGTVLPATNHDYVPSLYTT